MLICFVNALPAGRLYVSKSIVPLALHTTT
jgi:hypothetical protein